MKGEREGGSEERGRREGGSEERRKKETRKVRDENNMIVYLRIEFSIVTSNKEMRKKSEEPKYETSHHPNLTIIKPHTEEQGERERESEKGDGKEKLAHTHRKPSLSYLIKKQNERIERRYSNIKISNAPI